MGETPKPKVLIVEDDLDTVEALSLVLEKHGYAIASAASAEEGLEAVRADKPDLILLDVMMPAGTEGFHFVWALRKDPDPGVRDLPIIVLTAIHETSPLQVYPDKADSTYGPYEYLPVQAFFDKPVDASKLIAEMQRLLGEEDGAAE